MNLTKQDLIKQTAENVGINKGVADEVINGFLNSITAHLKVGDEITLHGFGKFSTKATAARTARNPITGDPVKVPAKRKVVFKARKALKDAVQ